MPTDSNPISTNKEIVHRYMDDCWNLGKLDELCELVADNCTHHDSVFPSLQPGADSLKRHIAMCRNGFPDCKFTIDDTIAERNEVVIHWTVTGTHKGQFLGMLPTDRKVAVTGTSIFRIEGGKITEQWADWNLMSMMEQLGVVPQSKAEAKAEAKTEARSRI
jgi:steroid delta-isomerase-like uncharacterized protein